MNKYNFKDFRYLYNGTPEVPEPWVYPIYDMLNQIDKKLRKGSGLPRFVLNKLFDLSKGKLFPRFSNFCYKRLDSFLSGFYISLIKQKFATLRVYGNFGKLEDIVNNTINTCNDTCELCGNHGTEKVMIKSWVTNLCQECQTKKKNNGSNI